MFPEACFIQLQRQVSQWSCTEMMDQHVFKIQVGPEHKTNDVIDIFKKSPTQACIKKS